jgi:Na+/H+ antiporter
MDMGPFSVFGYDLDARVPPELLSARELESVVCCERRLSRIDSWKSSGRKWPRPSNAGKRNRENQIHIFELTLLLLLTAVILTAFSRRIGIPYPSLLAIGGAAIALVPGAPAFQIDPELALALFVAPVLLDAAYDTSLRDLRRNWVPVTSLVLVAVGLTTAAVAVVARWLIPEMPWGAAIALGATVAPPDAAAATAVLRQLRLPHRMLVILEGESLLNDASALLVYRLAVTATVSGALTAPQIALTLLVVFPGSLAAGWLLARIYLICVRPLSDIPSAIVLQFVSTFGVWLLAEHIGLSSILTVVVYAITLARRAPREMPARLRVPSYAVWDTAVFVVNVLAFVLIGLQLRPILGRFPASARADYFLVAVAVVATVILVRIAWLMTYGAAVRWKIRRFGAGDRRPVLPPTIRGGLIASWCGMRGIVTLAAALALPGGLDGASAFQYRDLIVFCAFAVVFGRRSTHVLILRESDSTAACSRPRKAWRRSRKTRRISAPGARYSGVNARHFKSFGSGRRSAMTPFIDWNGSSILRNWISIRGATEPRGGRRTLDLAPAVLWPLRCILTLARQCQ